jgi:hypothetical protein
MKHRTELDSGRMEREVKKEDTGWRLKEAEEVRRRPPAAARASSRGRRR